MKSKWAPNFETNRFSTDFRYYLFTGLSTHCLLDKGRCRRHYLNFKRCYTFITTMSGQSTDFDRCVRFVMNNLTVLIVCPNYCHVDIISVIIAYWHYSNRLNVGRHVHPVVSNSQSVPIAITVYRLISLCSVYTQIIYSPMIPFFVEIIDKIISYENNNRQRLSLALQLNNDSKEDKLEHDNDRSISNEQNRIFDHFHKCFKRIHGWIRSRLKTIFICISTIFLLCIIAYLLISSSTADQSSTTPSCSIFDYSAIDDDHQQRWDS
jgi:hypothetical protein